MSDALPIPPGATVSSYVEHAEALLAHGGAEQSCRTWAEALVTTAAAARRIVADTDPREAGVRAVGWLLGQWQRARQDAASADLRLALAFIARVHGFGDWDAFDLHVEALHDPVSATARFERAADAIVDGDVVTVRDLLAASPTMVHQRSTREHQSTLLHYVAANGVEDFRQATPPNVVDITKLLLEAGADVNAESKAYGGGATALGLAATSLHPQRAGVQIALLDLLLARGAWMARPGVAGNAQGAVMGCLANGQPEAAAFLASKGAPLGLVEAAGVGRLDVVAEGLRHSPRLDAIQSAFMYACGYGHLPVAEVLLTAGADPSAAGAAGETPLHWACGSLHAEVVEFLLARGAAIDARDRTWDGTPLDWAIHAHATSADEGRRARARAVTARLLRAGATCSAGWLGSRLAAALARDREMAALLGFPGAGDSDPPEEVGR